MRIGLPREVRSGEVRIALQPGDAAQLVGAGHQLVVQSGAGAGVGFTDDDYARAGARIVAQAEDAYDCDLAIKVKELQPQEFQFLGKGLALFCFQHLAPDPVLLDAVLAAGATCLAYETLQDDDGGLPILAPMSRIAGALAPQIGAWALQSGSAGRRSADLRGAGVLLTPVCGLAPGTVTIVGAGNAGSEAARVASGLGARVTVLSRGEARLAAVRAATGARIGIATPSAIAAALRDSDLVIGAVLVPGQLSPTLVTREMLRAMRPGSVFVDVGIDQGGIAETSRPTTLADPLYVDEGVLHYCVPNTPALVARSASLALSRAVLPHVLDLANAGIAVALRLHRPLARCAQVRSGMVVDRRLADDTGRPYSALADTL